MPLERISKTCFNLIHGKNLVYNQCWEDPRLDRQALEFSDQDQVAVITSAGCNALDYALAGAGHVHAVDMNYRQNALLELKKAAIQNLDYDSFFSLFGQGKLPNWADIYAQKLREKLPADAQRFWDRHGKFFKGTGRRPSFYFRGTSGLFAWMVNGYIDRVVKLRGPINNILDCKTVEEQQEIFYNQNLKDTLFKPMIRWLLGRDTTMAMLGVPRSQRQQLDIGYPGGIAQFIVDRIETVFAKLPLHDNYFWHVYLTGEYTRTCCPEYLKEANFESLKNGVTQNVTTHTNSLQGFLEGHQQPINKFILLDHMDWLYHNAKDVLASEWQAIVDRAAPGAKIIWRSASLEVDFVDPIEVTVNGEQAKVRELLSYNPEMAARLHPIDRVNTYGSFYIAEINN